MVRIVESTWPTVKLRFRELPSELQAQRLLDGTLDVGLMHVDEHSDPNFRVYVITEEVPLIALPVNSPLARRRRLKLSDLRDVPTILFPRDQRPDLRAALDMSFQRLGFMPNVVHEATSMVATLSLVSAGLGIAYTTDLVGQIGYPGVTFRRITGLPTGFSQDLRMVWMPQPKTSQLTAVLEKIAEGFPKKTGTAPQP